MALPLMYIARVWLDGLGRVFRAPVILLGCTALVVVLSLLLATLLDQEPTPTAIAFRIAEQTVHSARWEWQHLVHRTEHLSDVLASALGAGVASATIEVAITEERFVSFSAVLVLVYLLSWTFLSGGILDRYARDRPTHSVGFFSACGMHAPRLLRLLVLAACVYGPLLMVGRAWGLGMSRGVHPRETTDIAEIFLQQPFRFLAFGFVLVGLNLLFDYTRARTIVEDRRSMIGALLAAWRFLRRHPAGCVGLYAANAVVLGSIIGTYTLVASDAHSTGWGHLLALAYLLTRVASSLLFTTTALVYFQRELAHANYVAVPAPVWPDSPTAEALGRLTSTERRP